MAGMLEVYVGGITLLLIISLAFNFILARKLYYTQQRLDNIQSGINSSHEEIAKIKERLEKRFQKERN